MIEVLTSGVALGVHVPGLLLAQRLRERGAAADVSVLERLLPQRKLATTAEMKWAFHRDFRLAKAGHRLATDPAAVTDPAAEAELFARWDVEQVETFVLFSGFWLPIVERYLARGRTVRVVLCHIDAIASPSFRKAAGWQVPHEDVFLVDGASMTVPCSVPVSTRPPLPWEERQPRLYLHGGGWGMGTYREHVAELTDAGFALDVLAYRESDVDSRPGIRHFLLDPEWHPWHDNGFPPLRPANRESYTRGEAHPDSFELVRSARAMVSKPGGGTCLDSLWAATPLLLLEPLGEAEKRNADVWQRLGFGLPYETWRDSGFSAGLLAEMYENLVRALPGIADYAAELAA
ncbi:hypothetical protein F9C11_24115 [Amycolatopsis sp. VS8301801F10]|uniref:hypothetical protein n=1 Tax=Amycolatopsis sp. VS8301801F10 TaxID=2652442 RepID=UPI0038FCB58B